MITRMHMHTHIYTRTHVHAHLHTNRQSINNNTKAYIMTNDKRIHKAQYALFRKESGVESLLIQKMNNYTPNDKIKP